MPHTPCTIQAEAINESNISLTNQTSPMDLRCNMDNGEHSMNSNLNMSEIKPYEDADQTST